jgi:biopolymer transport protein ExbD
MPLKTHLDEQPTMNLTSMIDVLFLLIIFFMVGTRFSDMEHELEIQVPKVSDAKPSEPAGKAHMINVYRDGQVTIDQRPVAGDEISSQLAKLHRELPNAAVIVRGDSEGAFKHVAEVLAACRKAGIQRIDVAVQLGAQVGAQGGAPERRR